MKRLILFFIIASLLLFFICLFAERVDNENAEFRKKEQIRITLLYNLKGTKRKWSQYDVYRFCDTMYTGEKQFNIDYRIVFGIISIESDFNLRSTGYNDDRLSSVDFGVCQINSQSFSELYKRSEQILINNNIAYNKSDMYDVSLNVMSCFIHLNDYKQELIQKKEYSIMRWIQSYNCGINGSGDKESYKHLREKKAKYYTKFVLVSCN